jgi:uncharacterized protein
VNDVSANAPEIHAKYVLAYESADDVVATAPIHFPAHWARCLEFHDRGTLLMVGTFADPQADGSMAIFTTRQAAQEFVDGDPFVQNGVVRNWSIREWNEALAH